MNTYYLEILSIDALKPKDPVAGLKVIKCDIKQFEYNRFLYHLVGRGWNWVDKQPWTDKEWHEYVNRDSLHTWVAYLGGTPAGYYELEKQEPGQVKIAYLGLAPAFIGRGLGGYLLTHAIKTAWQLAGTRRVWVHTCSADHPGALANYQARGMNLYKVIKE